MDIEREGCEQGSLALTNLREHLIKIGAKAVRHARSIILQLAEVAVPEALWHEMLTWIANLRAKAQVPCRLARFFIDLAQVAHPRIPTRT